MWVWQLGTALCHFWVDLAIRGSGSEGGREGEQAADNTLHKQLLTASPNWFRTLFLRRRRTNRTERRKEMIPGFLPIDASGGAKRVPAAATWQAMIYPRACAVSGT